MPTQALPVEVLGLIFEAYVHDPSEPPLASYNYITTRLSTNEFRVVNPFILGHVDRRWRGISHSISRLWSTLYVVRPSPGLVRLLEAWLAIAKGVALSLHFSPVWRDSENIKKEVQATAQVLDLFVSKYDNWRRISIYLNNTYQEPDILESLSRFPDEPPADLRTAYIKFSFKETAYMEQGNRIARVIYGARTLRRVLIDSIPADSTMKQRSTFPNWEKLTSYAQTSSDCLPASAVLALLKACPHLTALKLKWEDRSEPDALNVDMVLPVKHDCLQQLDLILGHNGSALFQHLVLPSLTIVTFQHLYGARDTMSSVVSHLLQLLENSSAKLTGLEIGGLVDEVRDDDSLLTMLVSSQLRCLRTLTINKYRDTERFFALLTRKKDDPSTLKVLPLLEYLYFRPFLNADIRTVPRHSKPSKWSAVKDMVISRTSLLSYTLDEPPAVSLSLLKYCSPGLKPINGGWRRRYDDEQPASGGLRFWPNEYWSEHPPSIHI